MAPINLEDAFHGAATVGERGQVVIPASAREKLGIEPGEKLLVFVPPHHQGVFFARLQDMRRMTEMLELVLRAASASAENGAPQAGGEKGDEGG